MTKSPLLLFLYLAMGLVGYAQDATLTIRVEAPAYTPPEDSLLVIGNQPVWGYWIYPKSPALKRISATTWERAFQLPIGTDVEFKITRGSYYKEALYNNNGHPPPAVKFTLSRDTIVQLAPTAWNDFYQRSITGTVRYHHQFSSPLLRRSEEHTSELKSLMRNSYAD